MSAGFLIRVLPVAPQNRLGSLGADGCGARVLKAEWLPLVFHVAGAVHGNPSSSSSSSSASTRAVC